MKLASVILSLSVAMMNMVSPLITVYLPEAPTAVLFPTTQTAVGRVSSSRTATTQAGFGMAIVSSAAMKLGLVIFGLTNRIWAMLVLVSLPMDVRVSPALMTWFETTLQLVPIAWAWTVARRPAPRTKREDVKCMTIMGLFGVF